MFSGHCHCEKGFAPPLCKLPGPGGSLDSGPASDPHGSFLHYFQQSFNKTKIVRDLLESKICTDDYSFEMCLNGLVIFNHFPDLLSCFV